MKKIAVVTDSNSGITQEEAQKMGIHVLPMPFTIDGNEYFEGINLTQEEFYEKLKGDADIATSQPSPHAILKLWDELLKEYDEIVQIPMSSGLSGSCQTAAALAADYEDRVFVVNNHRISVTQRRSVDTALAMVKDGKSGQEIKDFLEKTGKNSSIYITVATLKYLKKGGFIAVSEASWFTSERPAEIEDFWMDAYPEISVIPTCIDKMERAGYTPTAHFILPENCWTEHYFAPQDEVRETFMKEHAGNKTAMDFMKGQQYERSLYSKYKDYYGYVFYIGQKR